MIEIQKQYATTQVEFKFIPKKKTTEYTKLFEPSLAKQISWGELMRRDLNLGVFEVPFILQLLTLFWYMTVFNHRNGPSTFDSFLVYDSI